MSAYSELLKNPKWQRKRLEILNRDGWACQQCFDSENTLHVHHRYYSGNKKPWEYPSKSLVTLCENCHTIEGEAMKKAASVFPKILAIHGCGSCEMVSLIEAFAKGDLPHLPEVFFSAIQDLITKILTDKSFGEKFMNDYFDGLING